MLQSFQALEGGIGKELARKLVIGFLFLSVGQGHQKEIRIRLEYGFPGQLLTVFQPGRCKPIADDRFPAHHVIQRTAASVPAHERDQHSRRLWP